MSNFNNILFVSHGLGGEEEGLKQALHMANSNDASLSILIACPPFPENLGDYIASYEESIVERMKKNIQAAKSALKISKKNIQIPIKLEYGTAPDVRIIRYVLRHSHDLLIKQAEASPKQKGFKAVDMELLRKCPCPIFMVRPAKHNDKEARIAVAIDVKDEDPVERELSLDLLNYASSLVRHYSEKLDIISCWSFRLENYLRDGTWIKVPESELNQMILEVKQDHDAALKAIIEKAKIAIPYQTHLQKGLPEETIPSFVDHHKIDILKLIALYWH